MLVHAACGTPVPPNRHPLHLLSPQREDCLIVWARHASVVAPVASVLHTTSTMCLEAWASSKTASCGVGEGGMCW